ncbi:MAG: Mur ligase family protein, partial [Prolixibacteraceae bacterium]
MSIEAIYRIFLEHPQITTDSRKIEEGSIFFALKGDNFNGNAFALPALEKGASFAIVDEPEFAGHERILLVDNVLQTLQDLARLHRQTLGIPILAITGTNGKTTTKELVTAVLSKKFNLISTKGNLNNHIGVPLTLLSLGQETQFAVVEMGANHPGEIDALCRIALPNFGLITNVGRAHLEGFGSFEGVIQTKTELYRFLEQNDGTIFI